MNFYIATFYKDFKIAINYKIQFIASFINIFITLYAFYLLSLLVGEGNTNSLESYGNDYFFFLFTGMLTAEYTLVLISSASRKIRTMQLNGIFEELIVNGKKEIHIMLSSITYPMAWFLFKVLLYLLYAIFFFEIEINFSYLSFASFASWLLFTISILGIGLISAAAVIYIKSGEFINTLYLSISAFIGGVAYPLSILPYPLYIISYLVPTSHFLEIVRLDIISDNDNFFIYYDQLILLTIIAFLTITIGLISFKYSLIYAKKDGSLLYY